jgi:putative transposase
VIFMKGRRHSPEQVVRKLREADKLLAEGAEVADVCRHLEVSIQTYQRWRAQYKAMRPEDVVRLKQLEKENARLKRIVGDQALDLDTSERAASLSTRARSWACADVARSSAWPSGPGMFCQRALVLAHVRERGAPVASPVVPTPARLRSSTSIGPFGDRYGRGWGGG